VIASVLAGGPDQKKKNGNLQKPSLFRTFHCGHYPGDSHPSSILSLLLFSSDYKMAPLTFL
jgi:hypothetical protein